MANEINIMVGGEAGQGVQSVGFLLAKALTRWGYHIFRRPGLRIQSSRRS